LRLLVDAATVTIFGSGWATAALGGAMFTVEIDTNVVEEQLRSGRLACPGCSGVAGRVGPGPAGRTVRGPDGAVDVEPLM
jgi:hypothetical protein